MRAFTTVFVVAMALLISSCASPDARLVGKYKGDIQMSAEEQKNPMAGLAKAFLGNLSLELKTDHKFAMTMMVPIEGTWSLSGTTVSLKVEKAMGMDAAALKAQSEKNPGTMKGSQDFDKPILMTVSADGKTLTTQDTTGAGKGQMVFTRDTS